MGLLMFVSNGILLAVSVVVLGLVSWKLLLVCLVCVPFVVLASIKFQRDSNKAYLDVRDGIGNTLSQLQEGIAGVRVVQAFGREDVEAERFQHGNQQLFDAHMRSVKSFWPRATGDSGAGPPASHCSYSAGSMTYTDPVIFECSVPQYSAQKMWYFPGLVAVNQIWL